MKYNFGNYKLASMISYYQAHYMRSWFSYRHTAVKRLSMREKLRGDRIVRFEKPCMWL